MCFQKKMSLLCVGFAFIITIRKWMLGQYTTKERICNQCNKQEIWDEFLYILNCTSLQQERVKYLTLYHTKIKIVFSFIQIIIKTVYWKKYVVSLGKLIKCAPLSNPLYFIFVFLCEYIRFSLRMRYL